MPSGVFLFVLGALHYAAVLWIVSETIKNYELDKYTLLSALSLLPWVPVAICHQ